MRELYSIFFLIFLIDHGIHLFFICARVQDMSTRWLIALKKSEPIILNSTNT
jgi:hypothetical protein